MYTFVVIDLRNSITTLSLNFIAEIELTDPEHIAERLAYWDNIVRPRVDEETCLALIVEEPNG